MVVDPVLSSAAEFMLSPPTSSFITRYGSTLYIGIAMVVPIPQYIRKCQFLLSVSSEFDFWHFCMTKHVETKVYTKYIIHENTTYVMLNWIFTFCPCFTLKLGI